MGAYFVQKPAFILYLTLCHASDEIFLSRDRVHEKIGSMPFPIILVRNKHKQSRLVFERGSPISFLVTPPCRLKMLLQVLLFIVLIMMMISMTSTFI